VPTALEDAFREVERMRMRLADEEGRKVRLIEAMSKARRIVDAIVTESEGQDFDFWNERAVNETLEVLDAELSVYMPPAETDLEAAMDEGE
jgi:hypothetical protein